ncbi:biotin--[acetyl-CoA-carboxylase] ligase [Pilimelia anulata]|uniref:biotin--[biotin carboxyl-carrier protein] ligase n=2 Tax=Pilimelia anulata TaxID=53371 RepID=A0A8J3B6H1_9ACTN|nr:biotin--[acetyl-CoA-carboxylase] ligase [Pilimelia anulata]
MPYSDPDRPPLHGPSLRRTLLVPGGLWQRIVLHEETASTNADAVAAATAGKPEGLVVLAERQTAGRGRLDRAWRSPPRAGLAVSVLLRPAEAAADRGWPPARPASYGWLPLLAGVAAVEAIRRATPLEPALKWPNDVLLPTDPGPAKVAGVLAEAVPSAAGPAVVLGIGLNVSLRPHELPPGTLATSLRLAGAPDADRAPVLRALLRSLAEWYERWRAAGGDPAACGLCEAYVAECATVGATVRVTLPAGDPVVGTATGVDSDGRLVVATPDGLHPVAAGDVVHVRPV